MFEMLPYFHCFPNLTAIYRTHLTRQARLVNHCQNLKTLKISLQTFQACSK